MTCPTFNPQFTRCATRLNGYIGDFVKSVFHIKISNEFNIFKKILNETKRDDMSFTNKATGCLPREDSLQELLRELEICDRDQDEHTLDLSTKLNKRLKEI